MAEHTPTPQPSLPGGDLFEHLAGYSREVAYVLLGLGAAAVGGTFYLGLRFGSDRILFTIWAALLAIVFVSFGAYSLSRLALPTGSVAPGIWLRLQTALVGGLVGFFTALLGLTLPFYQPYRSVFTAGLTEWRQHPAYLFLVGGTLFGGLALMFVSLQLTRPFERSRADLRRLVYGFNTILGVLLLFLVLGLVNVLGYSNVAPFSSLGKTTDWTASHIYTLKDSSVNILKSVDKPTTFYVIMNTRGDMEQAAVRDIQTLMENFHRINDKINYEIISPHADPRRVAQLDKDYNLPPDASFGILVVYGDEAKAPSQYIGLDQVFNARGDNQANGWIFRGEGVLVHALDYLKTDKAKARIFITQGHGEPVLHAGKRTDRALDFLVSSLSSPNFEILPLDLRGADPVIPEDASVVVVAGPHEPLGFKAVDALTRYYRGDNAGKKKGKLIVMLDPVVQGSEMIDTGLDGFVRDQGVDVVKDRVLSPNPRFPTRILVTGDDGSSTTLAKALVGKPFNLSDCRSVNPRQGGPDPALHVEKLLIPAGDRPPWSEMRINGDPVAQVKEITSQAAYDKLLKDHPVSCLAVTVSDQSGPRMVVFGGATWMTNEGMNHQYSLENLSLFRSCVNWLRGSSELGDTTIGGNTQTLYSLDVKEDALDRLKYLPLALMLLVVVSLGFSVWVVRRR